jgi:hypothetical protein
MKKSSSAQHIETVIVYVIAAALLLGVMAIAFMGWQG